ncbi:MAG TPA: xanthine dehydrogenase family protein subunit M [Acidobacteria bacterium]|nr:xanthine dehydrogenase family protein subunit M [Acidobacteriota bacterium]
MIPSAFEYERANSVDDALAKLAATGGAGKLIAGGHSLVPLMKLRLNEPTTIIDIARIPGLAGVREDDGVIEIGAGTVHHDVATSAVLRDQCPVVSDTAATIGDPQVRNRGTLGGSLAHADPAADYPAMLLAVDAQIQLQGPGGTRAVAAQDFFQDLFTVDLRADEIITAIRFAPVRAAAYAKLYQRASRFAIVGVAAALAVADGVISSARIGLTGALSSAVRLPHVEEALVGQAPTAETAANAAKGAGTSLSDVNGDLHASEGYRRAMVSVFTKRAIEGALARV